MTADVQRELAVHGALYDLIVDHPMWIDARGRGLDYSPKRESLIGEFLDSAVEVFGPVIERAEKRAAAAALEEAAQAVEALRPHIPPSDHPDRRASIVARSTLNRAARHVRAALDPAGAASGQTT